MKKLLLLSLLCILPSFAKAMDNAFSNAISRGDFAEARDIFARGANVNSIINDDGDTLLNRAAELGQLGHIATVKFLLDLGANRDIPNKYNQTPLYTAICHGNMAIAKLLIDHHADVTIQNRSGWSPICAAASAGLTEIVKLLHDHGADITIPNNRGWTPLHRAADQGHIEIVELLLDWGTAINIADDTDKTPYMIAEKQRHRSENYEKIYQLMDARSRLQSKVKGIPT